MNAYGFSYESACMLVGFTPKKYPENGVKPLDTRISQIVGFTAKHFGIKKPDLLSDSRRREIIYPRHMMRAYMYGYWLEITLKSIGEISGCDHSTVMNSITKNSDLAYSDKAYKKAYQEYIDALVAAKFHIGGPCERRK